MGTSAAESVLYDTSNGGFETLAVTRKYRNRQFSLLKRLHFPVPNSVFIPARMDENGVKYTNSYGDISQVGDWVLFRVPTQESAKKMVHINTESNSFIRYR